MRPDSTPGKGATTGPPGRRTIRGSIFLRVALFSCILVLVPLAMYLALTLPFHQRLNAEHLRSDAESMAVSIAQVTATAIVTEDYSSVIEHCTKVVQQSRSLRYVVVTRKDGFSLVHTRTGWREHQLSGIWTSAGPPEGLFLDTGLINERVFHYTHTFEYSGIDWGYIHIGVSLQQFHENTRALYVQTAYVALFCMAGGFLAAFLFARRLTTPIRALDEVTRRVAGGDLDVVAAVQTHDELERLATSFNLMTGSLRRVQTELLTAREYAANIIRSLNEAVVVTDTENRITAINTAGTALLGQPGEELTGRPIADLFPSGRRDALGRLVAGEMEVLRHGRKVPVLVSASAIKGKSGGAQGYAYSAIDITSRKRAEEALLAAKEAAEGATRSKSQFLATMSHEIRTPMNGVLGMTELLLATELTAKQRRFAETSYSSARKLLTLLNDILDFSKIEAGKLVLRETAFDLRTAVEEVAALLSERSASRGVVLRSSVDPEIPSSLWGDPIRFNQVLVNLVGNALKFTETGSVDIGVRLTAGRAVRVSVKDTGVGIALSAQADIFEAFAQADSSAQRQFQGTGLGLAISRQLVRLMGGTMGVESEAGRGSTFWFEIPIKAVGPTPSRGTDLLLAPPANLRGRVLLAEDNPVNRDVACAMLALLGLEVVVASDGYEALKAVTAETFEVILMDCQMPGMDGYSATRAIRAAEMQRTGDNPRSVPIIAMTAFAMKTDRDECLAAGMTDYLAKPFTRTELHSVLARYLRDEVSEPSSAAPAAEASEPLAASADHARPSQDEDSIDVAVLASLENLEALGAAGLVNRVLLAYLAEGPALVARIEHALEGGRAADLAGAAHSLKSSSGNVGALSLASLCQRAEALGRSGALAGAAGLVESIAVEFDRARRALEARLTAQKPASPGSVSAA